MVFASIRTGRRAARWGWLILALLAASAVPTARGQAGAARRPPDALVFANALLRDRKYDLAAEEYEKFLETAKPGPDADAARFGLGTARLSLLQYREARREFEAFLKAAPGHPDAPTAWFRVGLSAYLTGDLDAARAALGRYTADYPGHRYLELAWAYLGDACFAQKQYEPARRAYEKALADFPDGRLADRARYGLARTLAALKEPDEAVKRLDALIARNDPEWTDKARFQLGEIQAEAAKVAESSKRADEVKERLASAVAAFEALERESPGSALVGEARLHRAEALGRLGRRDEAEAILADLAAKAPRDLAVQAAYALGNARLDRGQAAEARAAWDDARTRFPDSPRIPMLLYRSAQALEVERRPVDARALFRKLADDYPKDPWADDALLRAATLAIEANDADGARSLAEGLAARYPDSALKADARIIEARADLAEGRNKQAIAVLKSLLTEGRPRPEAAWSARYYLGLAYRADGQGDKSVAILDELSRTPAASFAAGAQLVAGQTHVEAGRFGEAIPLLERYLAGKAQGPDRATALACLALAYERTGQRTKARDALDRLAADFPRAPALARTRYNLAQAALSEKDYDRAAELFRLAAEGDDPRAGLQSLYWLGWSLLQAEKPAEAADAYGRVIDKAPDDPIAPEAALYRANALDLAGRSDDALSAYALVLDKYAGSAQAAPAALARARLLARAGRPDEAAAAFSRFLQDHPQGGPRPEDAPDRLLSEWGEALLDAKQPAEAAAVFARLVKEHPDSPRADAARLNLANIAFGDKKYDEVIALLEPLAAEGTKADPKLIADALFVLAQAHAARRDWSDAAPLFGRIVSDHPDASFRRDARFWQAESSYQAGDFEAAESAFAAYVADAPTDARAADYVRTARLRRIQSLAGLKRWKEVIEASDSLKSNAPDFPQMPDVDFARGRALQAQGRLDEALTAFQAVIDAPRKPADLAACAQWMRGEVRFHQGDFDAAVREFLKVDYLHKKSPRWRAAALLEAGKAFEKLDRWADAVKTYEKLAAQFPGDDSAAKAAPLLEAARRRVASRADEPAR